jgi:hypothetical protein
MESGDNQAMLFDLEPSTEIELQAMSELHKSIGCIVFCSEDSTDLEDTVSLGTGILISPDLILTSAYNIKDFKHKNFTEGCFFSFPWADQSLWPLLRDRTRNLS